MSSRWPGCPASRPVSRHGAQVDVTGTGDFASAVTAELARRQVIVADLRIEGRSLDSAYVALIPQPAAHGHVRRDRMNGFSRLALVEAQAVPAREEPR